MNNIDEIENCIKKLYNEVNIYRNASVSYVKTITGNDKFIFVCREGYKKEIQINYEKPNIDDTCESLNLTGSPLKDNCKLEDLIEDIDDSTSPKVQNSFEEQTFLPIKLDQARTILSHLSIEKNIKNNSKESIWILCDGSDSKNTILLCLKFSTLYNERSAIFYNGIKPVDGLNMSELVDTHLKDIGRVKIDTTVECIFNVSSYCFLKLNWSSSSSNPPLNNFKNSHVTLFQHIEVGNPSRAMEELWIQLLTLHSLENDILNYKKIQDKNELNFCGEESTDLKYIQEKILSILTDVSELQDDEINIDKYEIEAIVKNVNNRSDLDITDQLWEILKCCSSYDDLKSAINFIFLCAAKCNIVNMPTNQNCLAELIRKISQHRLTAPCLNAAEPLELLLEIGLEKVFKDFEYIFSISKICSANQLKSNNLNSNSNLTTNNPENNPRKSLFSAKHTNNISLKNLSINNFDDNDQETIEDIFKSSKFNQIDVDNKLSRLIQIYLILEHLLLIRSHLNLENIYGTIAEQLLKKPSKPFKSYLCNFIDKIEVPVAIDDVSNLLNIKIPQTRKITMFSKNNFKEIQSTFYYDVYNIFPSDIFPEIKIDDKEFTKQNMYYHWRYINIKTKAR